MIELQHDEALRARLGSTARRIADTEYSMDKMIESYRQLYLELLTR